MIKFAEAAFVDELEKLAESPMLAALRERAASAGASSTLRPGSNFQRIRQSAMSGLGIHPFQKKYEQAFRKFYMKQLKEKGSYK